MSFFDVSPMGGAVRRHHTLGGLFQGGEHSMEGDFQMMPYGGVGLGGSAFSEHVANYRKKHPNTSYRNAVTQASVTYNKKVSVPKPRKARVPKAPKAPKEPKTTTVRTRRSRAKSNHLYNITDLHALRELTDAELNVLPHYVEQLLPKKFRGAGVPIMHHLNQMTGGGLFDMLGQILGL